MFAACPSFLQMISCDDDLKKMTMVNFIESVGNLTSSTLFQLDVLFGIAPRIRSKSMKSMMKMMMMTLDRDVLVSRVKLCVCQRVCKFK